MPTATLPALSENDYDFDENFDAELLEAYIKRVRAQESFPISMPCVLQYKLPASCSSSPSTTSSSVCKAADTGNDRNSLPSISPNSSASANSSGGGGPLVPLPKQLYAIELLFKCHSVASDVSIETTKVPYLEIPTKTVSGDNDNDDEKLKKFEFPSAYRLLLRVSFKAPLPTT
jgi:hypothetical protein